MKDHGTLMYDMITIHMTNKAWDWYTGKFIAACKPDESDVYYNIIELLMIIMDAINQADDKNEICFKVQRSGASSPSTQEHTLKTKYLRIGNAEVAIKIMLPHEDESEASNIIAAF